MKKLIGFGVLFVCLLIGVIIKTVINFPIPEAVYGMAILLILLLAGIIKLDHVEETSSLLLENLAFFFIVPGVALIDQLDKLGSVLLQLIVIIVVSATVTMAVTSKTVEFLQKMRRKK